ncbi:SRPBCC family protein [Shimia sp. SDUM112013]|uniref:SRPBCC family protein n=1 Tax=Shimia sp. SDUM112013 TaxID=3136160 RepID=UPI0032EDEE43
MEISSKADMDVPIAQAFELVTDFARHERSAMRRGAEVSRTDALKVPGVGASWDIRFDLRGKTREMTLEVVEFDRPNQVALSSTMQGLDSRVEIELVALSRTRTRLILRSTMKPKTLTARLLLQSAKLAMGNITKKLDKRMLAYAEDLEDRYSKMA